MKQSHTEFESLVKEYERDIYSICYLYSNDSEEAKDLRQDTLVNLWNGLSRFRADSALRTWVTRVAINTCISFKRKKRAKADGDDFMPQLEEATDEASAQIAFLHRRLRKLDYLDRALVLLWLEDLPYDEIGAITGISPKNVGVRLVRIKNKLKNINDDE